MSDVPILPGINLVGEWTGSTLGTYWFCTVRVRGAKSMDGGHVIPKRMKFIGLEVERLLLLWLPQ